MTAARRRKSRSSVKAPLSAFSVYDGRVALGRVLEHTAKDYEARTVKGISIGHFPNCKAAADAVSDASASTSLVAADADAK
jgi:hypothetical protein